jgi:phage protein D
MSSAERYSPYFEIRIKGTDLKHGVTVDVLSVSVTDTANQADSFSITVRDRHSEPGRFAGGAKLKWMDSGLFDEGNEVEIKLGYAKALGFRGDITAVSASFPESGLPTLNVRGFSHYHRLQRYQRNRPFVAKTVSGIAEEIAGNMGLGSKVDRVDLKRPYEATQNLTYAEILKQRADPIDFEVVVKYNEESKRSTLYFQKPGYLASLSPALTLEWGKDLRSFSPSLSTYNIVTEVGVRASQTSHGGKKEPLIGKASVGDLKPKMGAKTGPEIAEDCFKRMRPKDVPNPMLHIHQDRDIELPKEASEVAKAQLRRKALDFISGRGSCAGNPKLRARTVIELKGLGERFSGKYYVTSATHTIDAGGYRTDFEVKRNAR